MSKNTPQAEIDSLREKLRIQGHQLEAAEKEVAALRSGKTEARSIAEGAEVLAAERDQWRARYADVDNVLRYLENQTAPPPDLLRRVHGYRTGTRLENGVPPMTP